MGRCYAEVLGITSAANSSNCIETGLVERVGGKGFMTNSKA